MATYGGAQFDASAGDLRRRLAHLVPEARPVVDGTPLEVIASDPPRTAVATVIEGDGFSTRTVEGTPEPGVGAFLDGTQHTRVIAYLGAIPLVLGDVAAAVRVRSERRLRTWGTPRRHRAVYAPTASIDPVLLDRIRGEVEVVDIAPAGDTPAPTHPQGWMERAVHAVQDARERAEGECARAWCRERADPIYIDGGIGSADEVARSPLAIGVVKTHRTLYVRGDPLERVLALRPAERSPVFRISPATRPAVSSWYLRLRDAAGRDPVWGLVRIEIADAILTNAAVTARADEVSRWVLAERLPIGLPGPRWDRVAYGVREVEEFLRVW